MIHLASNVKHIWNVIVTVIEPLIPVRVKPDDKDNHWYHLSGCTKAMILIIETCSPVRFVHSIWARIVGVLPAGTHLHGEYSFITLWLSLSWCFSWAASSPHWNIFSFPSHLQQLLWRSSGACLQLLPDALLHLSYFKIFVYFGPQ